MSSTIVFVSSHPISVVAFILPHIRALKLLVPVEVIANSNERTLLQQRGVDIPLVDYVEIVRPIAPLSDIRLYGFCIGDSRKAAHRRCTPLHPKLVTWYGGGLVSLRTSSSAQLHRSGLVNADGFSALVAKTNRQAYRSIATDVLVDSPRSEIF